MEKMRALPENETDDFSSVFVNSVGGVPLESVSDNMMNDQSDQVSALSSTIFSPVSAVSKAKACKQSLVGSYLNRDITKTRKLFGRAGPVKILRDACNRVAVKDDHNGLLGYSESIFVSGESGTGITMLIEGGLRDYAVKDNHAYCVAGRFHNMRSSSPYGAIVESFTDLVDLIVQSGVETLNRVRSVMKKELGTYGGMLARVVPNLSLITGENYASETHIEKLQMQGIRAFILFKLLCRSFLKAATASGHPVCLLIDDLQWADNQSIELMESLICDGDSRGVLIVCGFRSDHNNQGLTNMLNSEMHPTPAHIEIGNLGFDDINELISEMMNHADPRSTFELSAVVMKRTLGNPRFVFRFLEEMESRKLIKFSKRLENWSWDVTKLEGSSSVTDNVVVLLEERLATMPGEVKKLLTVCAHLGYTFEVRVAKDLLAGHNNPVTSKYGIFTLDSITSLLAKAESQGFVESTDSGYRFTHEQIRTKVYAMGPTEEDHMNLHFQIGQSVWERANRAPVFDDDEIFEAVYHLNLAHQKVALRGHRIELADLNCIAAKLAMEKSAYSDAADYMSSARKHLDSSIWRSHYEVALKIYTMSALVTYSVGALEETGDMLNEIFEHGKDPRDLFRPYDIKMNMLSSQGRYMEAIQVGFEVLTHLGVEFPTNPTKANVLYELCKVKVLLRGKTDTDLLALPHCNIEVYRDAMKVLSTIATIAYGKTAGAVAFCLVTMKTIRLTLRYGLTAWAAHGIACYATVLSLLGCYGEAYRYGSLATELMSLPTLDCKEAGGRATVALHMFVMHWREPLSATAFLDAHSMSLACGDLDNAFLACSSYILSSYYVAASLVDMERRIRSFVKLMFEYQQHASLRMCLPFHQYILNLMGDSGDPCVLSGDAMDMVATLPLVNEDEDISIVRRVEKFSLLVLAYNFDRPDLMSPLLSEIQRNHKELRGHYSEHQFALWKALAHFELYKSTYERSHRTTLRRITARSRKWVDQGVVACHPRYLLLKAVMSTLKGPVKDAELAFDVAVKACIQGQNIHVQALSCEIAARYFVEKGDVRLAKNYLESSLNLYEQWGCYGKLPYLRRQFQILIDV